MILYLKIQIVSTSPVDIVQLCNVSSTQQNPIFFIKFNLTNVVQKQKFLGYKNCFLYCSIGYRL